MEEATLIIPAYNEERRLEPTLRRYRQALGDRYGPHFSVLVVCNGCRDHTVEIARRVANRTGEIEVLDIPAPIGKGGAILEGFRRARGERVLFADADCATAPASLLALLDELDHHDVVIGSRRLPDSWITRAQPWQRRLLGQLFAGVTRLLFHLPYRDTQCGAKAFRREAAQRLVEHVEERRWAFDVDLLLCARELGLTVSEYPVIWADRDGSRLNLLPTAREVLRSFWAMKQRHRRVPAKPARVEAEVRA